MHDFHEYQIMDILKNHIKNKMKNKNTITTKEEVTTTTTSSKQNEQELSR